MGQGFRELGLDTSRHLLRPRVRLPLCPMLFDALGDPRKRRIPLSVSSCAAGLLLLASCATLPSPPPVALEGYRYVDDERKLAVTLPEGWHGFASREEMPEELRALVPADAGIGMIGFHSRGQAGVRLIAEPLVLPELTVTDYFEGLFHGNRASVDVLYVALSEERETVRWIYRPMGVELAFVETVAIHEGRGIRLSLWAPAPLLDRYEAEFEAVAGATLFYRDEQWVAVWRDLAASLDEEALSSLPIAEAEASDGTIACELGARGLLWKVRTEQGQLFLSGTLHFGRPEMYPLPEAVEDAFSASDRLVLELDPEAEGSDQALRELSEEGVLPEGTSLADEIGPALMDRVEASLAKLGLPASEVSRMQPWLIATWLSAVHYQALGYYGEFGTEAHLVERADGKEILALETLKEQIRALRELDGEVYLAYTLLSLDDLALRFPRLMSAWRCGDTEVIRDSVEPPAHASDAVWAMYERLITDCNRVITDRLESFLELPGTTFVAVGSGHLVGEESIPSLLRERGYEVQRH